MIMVSRIKGSRILGSALALFLFFSSTASAVPANRRLPFDPSELREKISKDVIGMLETYYEESDTEILKNAVFLKPGSAQYTAGVAFIAKKMARALVHGDTFTVSTMGSSVTSGHDNCNFDSYQNQLQRLLSPIFESAGSRFVVHNGGQGGGCGDNYENQKYCLRHIADEKSDVIQYSWTYFEAGDSSAVQHRESLLRWALRLKHSPAFQVLNVGEKLTTSQCGESLGSSLMYSRYAKYGANAFCLQTGLHMSGRWGGKVWGEVGDGLHMTTRYGESESPARKKSLGVVFRNWHPGPLGFQMISDAMAHYFATCALKAIDLLEAALKKKKYVRRVRLMYPKNPKLLKSRLPFPVKCASSVCNSYNAKAPFCFYAEKPAYGTSSIQKLSSASRYNPKNTFGKWTRTGWTHWLDSPSTLIPKDERSLAKCQHLNRCGSLEIDGSKITSKTTNSGWLSFRLPKGVMRGRIGICCSRGKKCYDETFANDVEFKIGGKTVPKSRIKKWDDAGKEKCILLQDKWTSRAAFYRKRRVVVAVRFGKENDGGISHVIAM